MKYNQTIHSMYKTIYIYRNQGSIVFHFCICVIYISSNSRIYFFQINTRVNPNPRGNKKRNRPTLRARSVIYFNPTQTIVNREINNPSYFMVLSTHPPFISCARSHGVHWRLINLTSLLMDYPGGLR